MTAAQIIEKLEKLIKEHGDLEVYTGNENGYIGESESSGIRFAEEVDDRLIAEENYLPNRFYIKT